MKTFKVKAAIANYEACAVFIEDQLTAAGFDSKSTIKVLTACEEIIVNVMNYAYTDGEGDLVIAFDDGADFIKITFIDGGKPFNPFEEPDFDVNQSVDERGIGGLGILMVKKLMDEVHYEYKDQQNVLTIMKKLSAPKENI